MTAPWAGVFMNRRATRCEADGGGLANATSATGDQNELPGHQSGVSHGSFLPRRPPEGSRGPRPAGRLWQWQVRLDLVAVAPAVFVLGDVPGLGEIGDDAEEMRSVMPAPAAMSRSRTPGSGAMHSSTRAWLVRRLQSATPTSRRSLFPEIYC